MSIIKLVVVLLMLVLCLAIAAHEGVDFIKTGDGASGVICVTAFLLGLSLIDVIHIGIGL